MKEFEWINDIEKLIPRCLQGKLGLGDDAEIFDLARHHAGVVSTDVVVDGVDFHIKDMKPECIGHKALAVNLSDMAAMGALPTGFVLSCGIPDSLNRRWFNRFYRGVAALAERYQVKCLGGDISSSKVFFASLTILGAGQEKKLVQRRGARSGDLIAVTGDLGGSILGHHCNFEPRIREARFLVEKAMPTSMIDISDGFVQDMEHLLDKSQKTACLFVDQIPVSRAARKSSRGVPEEALRHALTDGEDFELLFTMPQAQWGRLSSAWKRHFPKVRLSRIGSMLPRGVRKIVWMKDAKPVKPPRLLRKGYCHGT